MQEAPETTPQGPVFLLGAPRSGTSLVYRALCLNPRASYISNWLNRFPRRRALSMLVGVPRRLPALRSRYWFGEDSNAYRYGRRRPLLERLFPAPVEGEPVFAESGVANAPLSSPTQEQAARLRATFDAIRRYGGGVVVSKRISNNLRIPYLAGAFPKARFVALVRDGRAVALSLSRVNWWEESNLWWLEGETPAGWTAAGRDPWELCARAWVEEVHAIERGLAGLAPDRVLRLSYEDLVADPIERLTAIARFSGLPLSEDWLQALKELRFPNRNEAWRRDLPEAAAATVTRIQAEELRRYGYE